MQNTNVANRAESLCANFDGESLDNIPETLSKEERTHLENWAAISAALHDDMAAKTDLDFASKVMASIATETEVVVDQTTVSQEKVATVETHRFLNFKKIGLILTEAVVAASLCMVTVFGYQTWNAEDNMTIADAASTVGTVGGVNLASYQNRSNDHAISLDQNSVNNQRPLTAQEQKELAQKREQEAERISNYLKGYMMNTASN